ncbi:MAG TPA: YggS family pyridoxal phosphate-dependent enzyme, partial [Alcanivoracaceae bacterium]|nr:YggS family pyridoxal phosphate-dependent enzyme [Alcanivoracaceae bacterium]
HNTQWVMIGYLQSNKARYVARYATEIQSLDRLSLARTLQRRLELEDRHMDALVQVKTSTEPSKYGMAPAVVAEFLQQISEECPRLRVKGLMTMAVNSTDEEAVRACFRSLKELQVALRKELNLPGVSLERLSMGMSGDYKIAIEEGATEVRIGTAIFGHRKEQRDYYWPE